ncbi:cation diffusion facilitator family transporter [Subtercola sp. YIM 133946]|uniref:cation diffusion facilitator family transporter n=1 Tax=Subtercola sp. YIM 133946 TaxID=3118909 RepID=UPI002F94C543
MTVDPDARQQPVAHTHPHPHPHEHDGHTHGHDGHTHGHDGHTHGHDEQNDGHDGHPHEHDGHTHGHDGHTHSHPTGIRGFFYALFVPHSHDATDSIDDALEASTRGVRALKISLFILLGTTLVQFGIFLASGSIALLADSIHNFSDALTAVPLWIAFVLGRRVATTHYTFGFGRAEDLAGLFIVAVVALSAIVAGWEAIMRLLHPATVSNLGWVMLAGVVGFAGNELVALYRIRVGRQIGSAALVADGVHARIDGLTSLSVVLGALGVMLGFPLADPIVGLLISVSILLLLWGTVRSIGRRLMDGIEPHLVHRAEDALAETPGVLRVSRLQLRWVGHRLQGAAEIALADTSVADAETIVHHARQQLTRALPNLDDMVIAVALHHS